MSRERLIIIVCVSFNVVEIVLHIRKVEVGARRSTENVENVDASRLKVARCIVRL